MADRLKKTFSGSVTASGDRQVVVVRHALRPVLLIVVILLAVICVSVYLTSELKPQLFIQFSSLAVALYALYRTTTFHGKVTIGTIPAISTEDLGAAVIGSRQFIVTNSFNSYVYAQIETVTVRESVPLDLTQFPTGKLVPGSSVSEMTALLPIVSDSRRLPVTVCILVLLSSGRRVEKTLTFSL